MSIRQLPNGKWQFRKMINGKRMEKILDHEPGKREIEKLEREYADRAKSFSRDNITFENAFNEYLTLKNNVLSPTTRRGYITALKRISKSFKAMRINDIDQIAVQSEVTRLSSELSPKTVSNTHGIISAVLKLYRPDFALHTTLPQKIKPTLYMPTSEDIKRILEEVHDTKYYVPFVLGVCGMRRSEVCAALPSDIEDNYLYINKAKVQDENQQFVIKTTKTTESTRRIYLPDEIIERINKDGKIYTGNDTSLYKALQRTQKKLGIPRFRFHDLRAYFATYAHMQGIPDQLIQEAGGWKHASTMTQIYRRTMTDEYKKSQKQFWDKMESLI